MKRVLARNVGNVLTYDEIQKVSGGGARFADCGTQIDTQTDTGGGCDMDKLCWD